jgi:hypothetical protein
MKQKGKGLLSIVKNNLGQIVAFGKTEMGQTVYDILSSSLSAAEVARRHPEVNREFVLYMRHKYPELRRRKRA